MGNAAIRFGDGANAPPYLAALGNEVVVRIDHQKCSGLPLVCGTRHDVSSALKLTQRCECRDSAQHLAVSKHQLPPRLGQYSGQVLFRVSGLEAALERGLKRLWASGLPAPSPKRLESRRKSSAGASAIALTRALTATWPAGRTLGDPMSERSDEIAERVRGQRAIDPAIPLGQIRIIILRAQHDL